MPGLAVFHSNVARKNRQWTAGVLVLVFMGVVVAANGEENPGLDCVITPYDQVDVSSPVPGVLDAVHVDRSDRVKSGQVVAALKSDVERASVALAAYRASMENEIHLQEISLDFDKRNRRRLDSLYQRQAASFHDKDKAERDARLAVWKLRQARDVYRLRELELAKAEEQLSQKTIVSPINGVVAQRFKSPGEYIEDDAVLRIAQLDPLHVETIVPMDLFGKIEEGMVAEVVPELVSNSPRRATVTVVDAMGDAASGTFGVRLIMPNPDHQLPAGMKCSVRFLFDEPLAPVERQAGPGPDSIRPGVQPLPPLEFIKRGLEATRATGAETEPEGESDPAPTDSTPWPEPFTPRLADGCRTVGPVGNVVQLEQLKRLLADQGLEVNPRKEARDTSLGYIVLTPHEASSETRRQLKARLRASGFDDFMEMVSGAYAGHISLGVYNGPKMAQRRQAQLAAKGFVTELRERGGRRTGWWIDIDDAQAAIDNEYLLSLLTMVEGGTSLTIKPLDCPAVLTAKN